MKKSWACRKKFLNILDSLFRQNPHSKTIIYLRANAWVPQSSRVINLDRSTKRLPNSTSRSSRMDSRPWSRADALLTYQKYVLVGSIQNKQSEEPLSQIQKEEIPRSFASRHYMAILWSVPTRWSTRHKQII